MSINNPTEYELAIFRYEAIADCSPGTPHHREMLALATAINKYEQSIWAVPTVTSDEMKKLLQEKF